MRLVIVDDHTIIRHGLRSILELEREIEVVGEADASGTALQIIAEQRPDIALLDLSLGAQGTNGGLGLCQSITSCFPQTSVIVLTTFLDEDLVMRAIRSGAKGYVLKDVDAVDLVKSVRAVNRGESALDTRTATLVMKNLSVQTDHHDPALDFTERELEVARLLAQGHSNKAIGERIAISESTVKFHLRNVMRKLDVHHRTEVVYAIGKLGLL
ncbi:MAG: response regulator transcription factor [Chloroflexales bacterium]|nr:response regulator transcription factor [Chloroflexales bacterium]